MIEKTIKKSIQKALTDLSFEVEDIHLEHPSSLLHGDYSTNVAMMLAKKNGKNPRDLARDISNKIKEDSPKEIDVVETEGPGFINFYLSQEFFTNSIDSILKNGEKWGSNDVLKKKKVMIEYTDPNPFKEFHVGHLMNNAIGEAVSRIVEFSGAEVKRANYQGDIGLHVAKALWALKKADEEADTIHALAEAYARGTWSYGEDEEAKKDINDINRKIYERSDKELTVLYDKGRDVSFEYFETLYKKLGTTFDYYFYESDSGPEGVTLVEKFLKEGVFEKSDGAVVFRGEKYGLHTRVFINSEGFPTYEAKELGLAFLKEKKEKNINTSIIVTGNEVQEYFKVILKALDIINSDVAKKTKHIHHGMLRLPTGKMSSRTGDIITAEWLIDKVTKRVGAREVSDSDVLKPTGNEEEIAIGAIKYSILKQATGRDIIFDIEKSLSFEGDSGPYLQYAKAHTDRALAQQFPEIDTTIFPLLLFYLVFFAYYVVSFHHLLLQAPILHEHWHTVNTVLSHLRKKEIFQYQK